MSWTLCTSGAAITKAGNNVNSTLAASGAALAEFSDEAENQVCALVRKDVVANYGSLTANGKQILGRLVSSIIAQGLIVYDPSGFTSRFEAELMLDKLENDIRKMEGLVKDSKQKRYLGII